MKLKQTQINELTFEIAKALICCTSKLLCRHGLMCVWQVLLVVCGLLCQEGENCSLFSGLCDST